RTDADDATEGSESPRTVAALVEELVARLRVLLDVVRDTQAGQVVLELRGGAAEPQIASAVARNDGAGPRAPGRAGRRELTVVDRAHAKPAGRRGIQQREPAAHAEPDNPDI